MKKAILILLLGVFLILGACTQPAGEQSQVEVTVSEAPVKVEFKDFGPEPFVFNIDEYTVQNETFRSTIWTGTYMQLTVMSIPVGGDIGEEIHTDIDQFLRVESGSGIMYMGDEKGVYDFEQRVEDDFAIFIPAGKWHNLINDSDEPLKLYSIYSPVEHPHSTVHQTQKEGIEAHANH
ncbi:MAG: cupin domain-containing protein [Fermentimonas sp.]|nr:cupin domain-containing protein [Fermentimonas sp.]